MLRTRQEGPYLRLLPQLTSAFSDISRAVIQLEASLTQELGRPDLAALMRRVQEGEREKLKLTLALQALKKAHAFETFAWQSDADEAAWLGIGALRALCTSARMSAGGELNLAQVQSP